jgi:hypothetical protein
MGSPCFLWVPMTRFLFTQDGSSSFFCPIVVREIENRQQGQTFFISVPGPPPGSTDKTAPNARERALRRANFAKPVIVLGNPGNHAWRMKGEGDKL